MSDPTAPVPCTVIQRRGLKRRVFAISLIALIFLAYGIENWRGARAWQAYEAEATAAGESLDSEALIPPPITDEENFAAIPLFKEALDKLKVSGTGTKLPVANWRKGQFTDMAAWQRFYRAQPEFSAPPQPGVPAADVLMALSKFDREMKAVREGASHRGCRFPNNYDDVLHPLGNQLTAMLNLTKVARLHALAELALGQTDASRDDLLLGFRMIDAARNQPSLICMLIQIANFESLI